MELFTRTKWCKLLGKEYRLRNTATPTVDPATNIQLYKREDFCLASEQVVVAPPPLTPEQKVWLEVRRKSQKRKAALQLRDTRDVFWEWKTRH
jgi:hypothetical protein